MIVGLFSYCFQSNIFGRSRRLKVYNVRVAVYEISLASALHFLSALASMASFFAVNNLSFLFLMEDSISQSISETIRAVHGARSLSKP